MNTILSLVINTFVCSVILYLEVSSRNETSITWNLVYKPPKKEEKLGEKMFLHNFISGRDGPEKVRKQSRDERTCIFADVGYSRVLSSLPCFCTFFRSPPPYMKFSRNFFHSTVMYWQILSSYYHYTTRMLGYTSQVILVLCLGLGSLLSFGPE